MASLLRQCPTATAVDLAGFANNIADVELNKIAIKGIYILIFPQTARDFPFRRYVRTSLRALHILCTGTLIGGYIFNQPVAVLEPWLFATVITGLLIFATDLHASFAVLFEVRGIIVMLKTGLLALTQFFWELRIPLLVIALVLGVFGSHMPKIFRHKVLFFKNYIVPDERNG